MPVLTTTRTTITRMIIVMVKTVLRILIVAKFRISKWIRVVLARPVTSMMMLTMAKMLRRKVITAMILLLLLLMMMIVTMMMMAKTMTTQL